MGKKYLVVEVEERSASSPTYGSGFLRFLMWVTCMVFPPLIFILNIKRETSTFDEDDEEQFSGGYFHGPCIGTMVMGLLWTIIMMPILAGYVYLVGTIGNLVFIFSATYFAAYLIDLITAIVFAVSFPTVNQKIGNALIVIVCILFAGGILTGVLLYVLF